MNRSQALGECFYFCSISTGESPLRQVACFQAPIFTRDQWMQAASRMVTYTGTCRTQPRSPLAILDPSCALPPPNGVISIWDYSIQERHIAATVQLGQEGTMLLAPRAYHSLSPARIAKENAAQYELSAVRRTKLFTPEAGQFPVREPPQDSGCGRYEKDHPLAAQLLRSRAHSVVTNLAGYTRGWVLRYCLSGNKRI